MWDSRWNVNIHVHIQQAISSVMRPTFDIEVFEGTDHKWYWYEPELVHTVQTAFTDCYTASHVYGPFKIESLARKDNIFYTNRGGNHRLKKSMSLAEINYLKRTWRFHTIWTSVKIRCLTDNEQRPARWWWMNLSSYNVDIHPYLTDDVNVNVNKRSPPWATVSMN